MAFYELRRYTVRPGKMDDWIEFMEGTIIPFQVSKVNSWATHSAIGRPDRARAAITSQRTDRESWRSVRISRGT